VKISRPGDVWELLKRYVKKEREHLIVLTLNSVHDVISENIVSIGLVDRALVHPREVFRKAILDNAVGIVVTHNHPSGNLEPSKEDKETFYLLRDSAKIIKIKVIDFIIISKNGYFSFVENEKY
jgi:DNA repair protein RadC